MPVDAILDRSLLEPVAGDENEFQNGVPYVRNRGRRGKSFGTLHRRCCHDPCVLAVQDTFGFCGDLLVHKE